MWGRKDFIPPKVGQAIGYALFVLQAIAAIFSKDHFVSTELLALTIALISTSWIGEGVKDLKDQVRSNTKKGKGS